MANKYVSVSFDSVHHCFFQAVATMLLTCLYGELEEDGIPYRIDRDMSTACGFVLFVFFFARVTSDVLVEVG